LVAAVLVLDGTSLTCGQVAAAARGQLRVGLADQGRARARAAAEAAVIVAGRQAAYGRTTGVGANRELKVAADDTARHGLRLLRSHAGGGGPLMAAELSLATLVIRANQIAAGGSGVDAGVLGALVDCVNRGLCAPIPVYGAIGTGDLTALAMTALCLLGEREWQPAVDRPPRFALASADALAFISSNAATLGEAALACHDLRDLLRAAMPIAALAHLAVAASTEPYAAPVHDARPHPGQRAVAEVMRRLLGSGAALARIQDPYGYRAFPQVHGPAMDAARDAERTIAIDLNAAAENPLIDVAGETAWHNGNFHTAVPGHRPAAQLRDHDAGVRVPGRDRRYPEAGRARGAGQRRAVARGRGARRVLHPVGARHHRRGAGVPGRPGVRAGRRRAGAAAERPAPGRGAAGRGV